MTTYFVDVTSGDDSDTGLTEALAWQTLSKAADTAVGGDFVWVKGSASYVVQDGANDCIMQVTVAGGSTTLVEYEGYTTTTGDGGTATLDANTNTLASAVKTTLTSTRYGFTNFRFTGGSADGFDANGTTGDRIYFENCQFDNNDGWGFQGDDFINFYKCTFNNNGTGGMDMDDGGVIIGCKIYSNSGGNGISVINSAIIINNIFYDNGANINIRCQASGCVVFGNVIDGDNVASSVGILFDGSNQGYGSVMNNILFDLDIGVDDDFAAGGTSVWDHNLYFSVNTKYTNQTQGDNDVAGTEDPFTNSGTRDYTLKSASEAIDKGFDHGSV